MTNSTLTAEWMEEMSLTADDMGRNLGDGVMGTPNEYIEASTDVETYRAWYAVKGWCVSAMQQLVLAGIEVSALGELTTAGFGEYAETIAYKYCNGDLSLDEVKSLVA